MEEITVKDLIYRLSKMNPDAIVCKLEEVGSESYFSSIEMIYEEKDVFFINDSGEDVKGNIVAIY